MPPWNFNNEANNWAKKYRNERFNKGQATFEDRRDKAFELAQEAIFQQIGTFMNDTYLPGAFKVGDGKFDFKTQEEADDVKADIVQWVKEISKGHSGRTIELIPHYDTYGKYKKYATKGGKRTRKHRKGHKKSKTRKH